MSSASDSTPVDCPVHPATMPITNMARLRIRATLMVFRSSAVSDETREHSQLIATPIDIYSHHGRQRCPNRTSLLGYVSLIRALHHSAVGPAISVAPEEAERQSRHYRRCCSSIGPSSSSMLNPRRA